MVIYGTTVISISLFLGTLIGDILGKITGIDSNIGGVGFAMIILLVITGYILPTEKMRADTKAGLQFWQGMYVPVVIAMSSSQNMFSAITAGPLAILGGLLAVALGFALLPLINKLDK